ncbi:MAG: c-type cytochrome [Ignavibacteria bacterium]
MKEFLDNLKQEPGRIFGLVYPYVLVIGVGLGLFYIGSLNYITRQEVPPFIPDTNRTADLPIMEARKIAAVDVTKLADPPDTLVSKGKTIFNTLCASCHGEDGTGNGVASAGLNPSPRNFTSMDGWKNGSDLDKIFETINLGIPGTSMASFQQLSTTEKFAVAHYIRKNFIPDPPPVNVDNLKILDQTYNLSQEKDLPAQVPVSAAMELILKESDSSGKNISSILNKMRTAGADASENAGAKIFNGVIYDKTKALASLSSSADWEQNEHEFVNLITANAEHNGFSRKVFYLKRDEITALHKYLQNYF